MPSLNGFPILNQSIKKSQGRQPNEQWEEVSRAMLVCNALSLYGNALSHLSRFKKTTAKNERREKDCSLFRVFSRLSRLKVISGQWLEAISSYQ
jgi:uncharacterized Zn finger protein